MARQILGTFQSRDAADSIKGVFEAEGYPPENLIVMSNKQSAEPPEAAVLEPGTTGASGFAGLEEKVGKAVLSLLGKKNTLEGDGFEGEPKAGALLAVTLRNDEEETRVRMLLERHHAADIEVAQED